MRSLFLTSVLAVGCLALEAGLPKAARAQSAAGTPDYAQSYTERGN